MAGASPKRKGTTFEREIVKAIEAQGLAAKRAWSSDGRSLVDEDGAACSSDVDILVEGRLKLQAKRRASVASFLKPPKGAHCTVVREDRGDAVAIVPLWLFLEMLKRIYGR